MPFEKSRLVLSDRIKCADAQFSRAADWH